MGICVLLNALGQTERTCKTRRLLERDSYFRRVPSTVVAVEEEGRFSKRSRDNGRHPRVHVLRRVGRNDSKGIPAIRTQKAITRASIVTTEYLTEIQQLGDARTCSSPHGRLHWGPRTDSSGSSIHSLPQARIGYI